MFKSVENNNIVKEAQRPLFTLMYVLLTYTLSAIKDISRRLRGTVTTIDPMVATKEIPSVMDISTKVSILSNLVSLSKQKKLFDALQIYLCIKYLKPYGCKLPEYYDYDSDSNH